MLNTTLIHVEKDGKYLMMHRVKKENDVNHDKWTGVGGKFEEGETPEECAVRETLEETGLTITDYRLRGIVTFLSDKWEELIDCDEGTLEWVDKDIIPTLPIWEGGKLFLKELIEDRGFFTMKLRYEGETLAESDVKLYR